MQAKLKCLAAEKARFKTHRLWHGYPRQRVRQIASGFILLLAGRMREEVDMKYRLSQVQSTRDDRVAFAGVGLKIVNERGAPIVTFGYLDQAKATNARALIAKAMVDAALIAAAGAHE
jgi:hypothetical protein